MMAEHKHTPGPWNMDEVRTSSGRAFRIGAGEMLSAGKGCCIIYDDYPGNPDNERIANARLIAAAPDLLAACQMAKATHSLADSEPGLPSLREVEDALRAAIAKAAGEAAA